MRTWRRHRAQTNKRASSIAPPGEEGWTIRVHRAILPSEPYASADLGAASDSDRQVFTVRGCVGLFAGGDLTAIPQRRHRQSTKRRCPPEQQHRFRAETTPALGAALRDTRAPEARTTLGNNDRPRDFPDRRPEIQNYPLGRPPTPVFNRIFPVPTARALTSPPIPTKARSPNMRGSTSPLTLLMTSMLNTASLSLEYVPLASTSL